MRYIYLLFILLIIQTGCSRKESEKDLLNKIDPIGFYGGILSNGTIHGIDELLLSAIKFANFEESKNPSSWLKIQ